MFAPPVFFLHQRNEVWQGRGEAVKGVCNLALLHKISYRPGYGIMGFIKVSTTGGST